MNYQSQLDKIQWGETLSEVLHEFLNPLIFFIISNMDSKYVPPGNSIIKFRVVDHHFKGKKMVKKTKLIKRESTTPISRQT